MLDLHRQGSCTSVLASIRLGEALVLLLPIQLTLRIFLVLRVDGVHERLRAGIATSVGIQRASCIQRTFGAAAQGAAKTTVVRTNVLLDYVGVIRKPCLWPSTTRWLSDALLPGMQTRIACQVAAERTHLFQLALLIRSVRRELLLRNLRLRQYLLNALPKHALLVCPQR